MAYDADVIVIGAGLAGLVATAELVDAGRTVILLDQSPSSPSAVRRTGPSAGSSSSTRPSSAACGSRTAANWPCRTGTARRASTARTTTGRGSGPRRTSTSPRGEAVLAARAGAALLPRRRLGGARRIRRHGARQLRTPLPHHLGHRSRGRRTLRATGPRGHRQGPRPAPLPPPGDGARPLRGRGRHRHRRDPRGERRRAGHSERPRGRGVLRATRPRP